MQKYGVNELRRMFLEFFESKEHLAMKSFSLVPHNDNSLLLIGPGLSAFIKNALPVPRRGKRASISTRIPIPPRNWVRLRQNKILLGSASTSRMTDAPVVVRPEAVSNRASAKLGSAPPSQ